MIYFKKDEEGIKKYDVTFDVEELKKFRKIVIDECSIIKRVRYEDYALYSFKENDEHNRNFKVNYLRRISFNHAPDKDLLEIIYDEYTFPYLVKLIDKLIEGDLSALDEIYNPDFKKEIVPLDIQIKNAQKKIAKSPLNITDLWKLESLLEQAELNKNQNQVEDYYILLQNMIEFKLLDSLTIEESKRLSGFLGEEVVKLTRIK